MKEKGVEPDVAGGHSLGEYSALVTAGVLDFADAVRCGATVVRVGAAIFGTRQYTNP